MDLLYVKPSIELAQNSRPAIHRTILLTAPSFVLGLSFHCLMAWPEGRAMPPGKAGILGSHGNLFSTTYIFH
jgi:hypothetical protein